MEWHRPESDGPAAPPGAAHAILAALAEAAVVPRAEEAPMRGVTSLVLLLALLAVAGCAVPGNTAAQDRAFEAWSHCEGRFPTVLLKEVRSDGQITFIYWGPSDAAAVQECLKTPARAVAR
jgi:hypothetical protein